jgi:Family of unknown function (DUF6535)
VRMIGDFDDSANALWTLYGKEAKSHDEARIETLKDNMDGVLIFVRLYSVSAPSLDSESLPFRRASAKNKRNKRSR